MDTIPDTLEKWIAKAKHFHIQNQHIKALQNQTHIPQPPTSSTSTSDPNAAKYMKKDFFPLTDSYQDSRNLSPNSRITTSDVLKVCYENPKQDAPNALPIAKIGLDGQDF
ncbi:hypothetical protein BS17DRAFT_813590 [Gyrodon lividus]|nr:hypothetical protein BS17DRAFT_813590 [Gyrodon lividus]